MLTRRTRFSIMKKFYGHLYSLLWTVWMGSDLQCAHERVSYL